MTTVLVGALIFYCVCVILLIVVLSADSTSARRWLSAHKHIYRVYLTLVYVLTITVIVPLMFIKGGINSAGIQINDLTSLFKQGWNS